MEIQYNVIDYYVDKGFLEIINLDTLTVWSNFKAQIPSRTKPDCISAPVWGFLCIISNWCWWRQATKPSPRTPNIGNFFNVGKFFNLELKDQRRQKITGNGIERIIVNINFLCVLCEIFACFAMLKTINFSGHHEECKEI